MKRCAIGVVFFMCVSCSFLLGETISVIVTSESLQKKEAVVRAFEKRFPEDTIEVVSCLADSGIPSQPIGEEVALKGVLNRIKSVPEALLAKSRYLVSIENYLECEGDFWKDVGLVLVKDLESSEESILLRTRGVVVPEEYVNAAREMAEEVTDEGYSFTVGKSIERAFPESSIDPQDWQGEKAFGGVSRIELLQEALFKILYQKEIAFLKNRIKRYENFPKQGILFEDFFPILSGQEAFQCCIDLLAAWCKDKSISMVVGLESRGFILGCPLAYKLGVSFAPIRKPGKLPGLNYSISYTKEYESDTLVISQEALKPNQRVLVIDDLIATGGSAKAAIQLVQLAGGDPVEFISLLEVKGLKGQSILGIPSFNLLD